MVFFFLKIGFRDNRVGWLRFESIHLRKSLGEMRKETSGKYWFSKSVWRIRLLNKRAFCQGDTWQARWMCLDEFVHRLYYGLAPLWSNVILDQNMKVSGWKGMMILVGNCWFSWHVRLIRFSLVRGDWVKRVTSINIEVRNGVKMGWSKIDPSRGWEEKQKLTFKVWFQTC